MPKFAELGQLGVPGGGSVVTIPLLPVQPPSGLCTMEFAARSPAPLCLCSCTGDPQTLLISLPC